jgi:dTMP kinase
MKSGKFIVIEGINGCGKGTQLPYLVDLIYGADKSNTVFVTREPNDFDGNGRKAREMLKSDGDPYQNAHEAVGYFAKNRDTHNEIFEPMLEKGISVISDRYWHSNFAFQGAQGVDYLEISLANNDSRTPDLTIILDVPVEVAFDRLDHRDGKTRRKFDSDKRFLEKVRKNYLGLPNIMQEKNVVVIDGNRGIDAVKNDIKLAYDSVFKDA